MENRVVKTEQGKVVIDEDAKIEVNRYYENNGVIFISDSVFDEGNNPNNSNPRVTDFNNKIIATINFSLDKDIPMIVVEDGVEKLVKSLYEMEEGNVAMNIVTSEKRRAFKEGYKSAQQKSIYSEEDIRKAVIFGQSVELTFVTDRGKEILTKEFIESLKREYIELETDN